MIEHKMVELNHIQFHYVETPGVGPKLILLPGFNDSVESYLPLLPELSTVAHVYAFDFRGHGQSGHTPHEYTERNHVYDVEQFLQQVTNTPVILAGHSMGGWIAGWVAGRNEGWVKGLILEDSQLISEDDEQKTPGAPAFIPVRDRLLEFKATGKTFEEYAAAEAQSAAPPVYGQKTRLEVYGRDVAYRHARQRWMMDATHYDSVIDGSFGQGYKLKDIISHIQCPTCCITSNIWVPTATLAAIPGSVHVAIDTVDHRVHEMRPHEYVQAVKSFIQDFQLLR